MNYKLFSILAIFCVCGLLMSSVNALFTGPPTMVYYPYANDIIGDHYRYTGDVIDILHVGHGREKFYQGQAKDISTYYHTNRDGDEEYGYIGFEDGTAGSLQDTYFSVDIGTLINIDHIDIWVWDRGNIRFPHINCDIYFRDGGLRCFDGGDGNDIFIK